MTVQENIKKNNIILPNSPDPVGSYVASKISGNLLFISGQISMDEKGNLIKGKLGNDLSTEDGYNAAERCALSIVAQANKILKNCNFGRIYSHFVNRIGGRRKTLFIYNDK